MNIGERVGDYEIVQVLGSGGMGQVYKVRNVLSDRMEAMKVLLPNLEGDADLADRFLREIKVQAALDHPHIAKLNTAMRAGNQLVMVMEFVEGTSLAQVLERGLIAPDAAVSYIAQVLDALAYAHARGVIHRDIKPANIMLTPAAGGEAGSIKLGSIKLMDFGIARMKADRQLTQTGRTVGSLYYMSPEQINGGAPDPRSDLYSVGVTLYEMVTGKRPFRGDSDFSIMSAHLQQAPEAPIEIVPGVPPLLSDLILMTIEKDPAARFQSADAFRAALGNAFPQAVGAPARTLEVPTRTMNTAAPNIAAPPPLPQAPPKSRRGLYMAAGSLATLAVLLAAVIEGPKLMRGGAAGAQAGGAPTSVAAPVPTPTAAPQSAPDPTPVVAEPVASPAATQQPTAAQAARTPVPQAAPERQEVPFRRVAPETAQPAAAATPPAPVSAQTASPELKELRDRINRVSIRASAAQESVRSIEHGVASQGFGLRTDIKEAQIRLDYLLQEARTALQNGDADGARTNLQYAEGTLQKIETFLGH